MTDEPKTIDLPPGSLLHAKLRRRMVTLLRTPNAWWDIRPQPPREVWTEGSPRINLRDVTVLWIPPQPEPERKR